MERKNTLEEFFEKHPNTLIVLSIFLLVTMSLIGKAGYLNNLLALLSALITYSILIGIDVNDKNKDTFPLIFFKIVFPIFIAAFCGWVILNVITTLTGEMEKLFWVIIWLGFMIYPILKFWFWKGK